MTDKPSLCDTCALVGKLDESGQPECRLKAYGTCIKYKEKTNDKK